MVEEEKKEAEKEICVACKFFKFISKPNTGRCKRFPPQFESYGEMTLGPPYDYKQPEVAYSDTCGEFKKL